MTNLRLLNIAIISVPGTAFDSDAPEETLAAQSRAFHLGLLERECRGLTIIEPGANLALRLAQSKCDVIIIDAGKWEEGVLQMVHRATADAPLPIVCFNEDADFERMYASLESGVAAYVAASLSIERVKLVIDVAMARFEINRKLQRELMETKRQLASPARNPCPTDSGWNIEDTVLMGA